MDELRALPTVAIPDLSVSLVPPALHAHSQGMKADRVSVKEAAEQFEAYFLGYLMGVMRETVPDGPFDSKAAKAFYSFYDAEIGRLASKAGGIGLAASLESSLSLKPIPPTGGLKSPEGSTDTTEGENRGEASVDGHSPVTGGARDGNF